MAHQYGYYGQMAKMHWERYLPKKYKELQEKGTLVEEIRKAEKTAINMMVELTNGGMYKNEAEEIVLPQLILLPPESSYPTDQEIEEQLEGDCW